MKPFRLLVTGSRDWRNPDVVCQALGDTVLEFKIPPERELIVVQGECPTGPDINAHLWGLRYGATIESHPAKNHGSWPSCGPRRNAYMVDLGAHICLAFIGPCTSPRCRRTDPHGSHGATGCANLAEKHGIPVKRYYP